MDPEDPARPPQDADATAYDPFRRSDGFGEIGTGPLPWYRKVLMYLLVAFLGPPRVICCLILMVFLRTVCALVQCMPSLRPWLVPESASFVSRGMLLVLGFFYIEHKRIMEDPDTPDAPTAEKRSRQSLPLVVSNHVSWVDILLAGYLYSPGFVTRAETKKTPLVGGICEAVQCLFVDREKALPQVGGQDGGVHSTADRIAQRTQQKWNNPASNDTGPLVIFAEGTTTNGKYILPFRSGAFVAAVPVQPVLMHYPAVKGRPSLAWETIGAKTHAILVLSGLLQSACIVELPLYTPNAEERQNPLLYAGNVRQYMLKWASKLKIDIKESPSGLTEKREYHKLLKDKFQMTQQ